MKNEIIDVYTDRNGNKWERKIMTNFAGEKYEVLYKNGKKAEVLGRTWKTNQKGIDKND
jgi:hypothetical protein